MSPRAHLAARLAGIDRAENPDCWWLTGPRLAGGTMKPFNPWWLYRTGYEIARVSTWVDDWESGAKGAALGPPVQDLLWTLDVLLQDQRLTLPGARDEGAELRQFCEHLGAVQRLATVDQRTVKHLSNRLTQFQNTLSREMRAQALFIVEPVGGVSPSLMLGEAETILPSDIQPILVKANAVDDFRQAARALAFDLPTASGFHLFRALEAIVLLYLPLFQIVLKPTERSLGRYINEVEKTGQVAPKIIAKLREMKDERNPLIHPELTLSPEEAQSLFSTAQGAIAQVARDLIAKGA